MPIFKSFRAGLNAALSLSLSLSLISTAASAQSSSPQWIYPGQALPADIGFSPLRASSDAAADVKITNRDWFLLKDKGLSLFNPGSGKALDYSGPVLDDVNAQLYYRLITGMILKESMEQMGMSSVQAKRFVEETRLQGKDFESTPLKDLGPLPQGFDDLYRNWERPMARMAILPYLILPLSIGHEESQFQHFSTGGISDTTPAPGVKMCSTMNTIAPLAGLQVQIDATKAKMDVLNEELRKATGLAEQSNAELVRLTAKVKEQAATIETNMACFSSIKDRVSRGSQMPSAECLAIAKKVFETSKMMPQWEKFIAVNLQNLKGDFRVLQEQDINLKNQEASLAATRQTVQTLQDEKNKIAAEKNSNEDKISKLSSDKNLQIAGEAKLNSEQDLLSLELAGLQDIGHKLETGILSQEKTEDEVKTAIAGTTLRSARIIEIKDRLPRILQEKSQVQSNLAAILAQVEFLGRAIDTNRLKIESIDIQLSGLLSQMKGQEEKAKLANDRFLAAAAQSNFSEYILSIVTKDLILSTQDRDKNFELLKKQEALLASYKSQIETASKTKDANYEKLAADLAAQEAVIASYRDPKEMGWFLESDCDVRSKFDSDATGVYLSRAPIVEKTASAIGTRANAGRWGLFNMPYDQFQSSIQNGLLLNLEAYIKLSVQKMFDNYDYSMSQFMNPAQAPCADVASATTGVGASVLGLLKSASAIWDGGSDATAKAAGYCAVGKPARPEASLSTYSQSLAQLIHFENSILDQTLPKLHQSRPEDLIEREAIEALSQEVGILTGSTPVSPTPSAESSLRRDILIKSLLKVLAYDYASASTKSREISTEKSKYKFASPAPESASGSNSQTAMTVGSIQEIKSIDGIALYTAPIARPEYETANLLFAGDKVKVMELDPKSPGTAVLAGWMKVEPLNLMTGTEPYYMPAAALSERASLGDNGQSVYDLSDDTKCGVRRLVKTLTNYNPADKIVTRMLPNLETRPFKNGQWQMVRANKKTTFASTEKTYVACEIFEIKGQRASPAKILAYKDESGVDFGTALGIRIVEVKAVKGRNGQIRYVPTEDYGGFVHTWLVQKNNKESAAKPRIQLGEKLDAKTWSVQP